MYKTAQLGWQVAILSTCTFETESRGNFQCLCIQLHDTIEKQQVILNHLHGHIQNICNGCEYTTSNPAIECTDENSDIVILRTELFSPPNMTENALDSIRSWIHIHSTTGSIAVQGLRLELYLKRDCSLIVESFGSPFNCYQTSAPTIISSTPLLEQHPNTLTEVLAITGFLVCGILIVIVFLLVLYVGYQHYKKNSQRAQRLR